MFYGLSQCRSAFYSIFYGLNQCRSAFCSMFYGLSHSRSVWIYFITNRRKVCIPFPDPHRGTADATLEVSSVENPELTVMPLKPGVGQNIAVHVTHTAWNSGPFTFIFFHSLPTF